MKCLAFQRYSALLSHPKHGRKVSTYQSFGTSNDALSIHRKGKREIELAEKLSLKNEKQTKSPNAHNNNALQWPFGLFTSCKLRKTVYWQSCGYSSTTLIASNYGHWNTNARPMAQGLNEVVRDAATNCHCSHSDTKTVAGEVPCNSCTCQNLSEPGSKESTRQWSTILK